MTKQNGFKFLMGKNFQQDINIIRHFDYTKLKEEIFFDIEPQDFPCPPKYLKICILKIYLLIFKNLGPLTNWSVSLIGTLWPFYIKSNCTPELYSICYEKYQKVLYFVT